MKRKTITNLLLLVLAFTPVLAGAQSLRAQGNGPKVLVSRPMTAEDYKTLEKLFGAPTPQADPIEPINKTFAECVATASTGEDLYFSAYREPNSDMFARLAILSTRVITNPTLGLVMGDSYSGLTTPLSATNVLMWTFPKAVQVTTANFGMSAKVLNANWPQQADKTFQATFDLQFTTSVNLGFEAMFNGELLRCSPTRIFGQCEIDPDTTLAYFESAWETDLGLSIRTEIVRDATLVYRVCIGNGQTTPLPLRVQAILPPGLEAVAVSDPALLNGLDVTVAPQETRVFTATLLATAVGEKVVRTNFQRREFANQPITFDPIDVTVLCPPGQDCTPVVQRLLYLPLARR